MTWISAGSVRGSYLNLFVKTRSMTQMPQECILSFIPITSRFNKLRQHWNIPPLSGWRKVTRLRAKIMKAQLKVLYRVGIVVVLVNFFNLLVKIWKKESVSLWFEKIKSLWAWVWYWQVQFSQRRAKTKARWNKQRWKYLTGPVMSSAIIKSTMLSVGGA